VSGVTSIAEVSEARGLRLSRRKRPPVAVMIAMGFMFVVVVFALFGSLIGPMDPGEEHLAVGVSGPSSTYLFGTDEIGRDVLSRVIAGTWTSLSGPLVLAAGQLALGGALGVLAGYVGGWVDVLVARWVDVMWSLPGLMVTLIVIGTIGGGYWGAVLALIILNASNDTRMFRAAALEQRGLPYIEAARTLGLPRRRIMLRHVGPNILPLFITNFFLNLAGGLTAMAGLAYLGFGLAPGSPNWGTMIDENRLILFENPFGSLLPTLMVILVAVSMNEIGNWLYATMAERGKSR
jgi:peptide/nickel transport system permease protein